MRSFFAPMLHWQYDISIIVLSIFASIAANLLVNYASGDLSVTEMATLSSLATVCSTFAGIINGISPAAMSERVLFPVAFC